MYVLNGPYKLKLKSKLNAPYQYIVLVQQVEEGHQVNPLGEVLSCSLLDGEVGQQLEESVLPLLLRLLP